MDGVFEFILELALEIFAGIADISVIHCVRLQTLGLLFLLFSLF